jgi:hypothetical protein
MKDEIWPKIPKTPILSKPAGIERNFSNDAGHPTGDYITLNTEDVV